MSIMKKEIIEGEGKPTGREYKGNPVFKTAEGKYYVEVGKARFHCGERQFDKLGTAKKKEDAERAEQTKRQDALIKDQRTLEENMSGK